MGIDKIYERAKAYNKIDIEMLYELPKNPPRDTVTRRGLNRDERIYLEEVNGITKVHLDIEGEKSFYIGILTTKNLIHVFNYPEFMERNEKVYE